MDIKVSGRCEVRIPAEEAESLVSSYAEKQKRVQAYHASAMERLGLFANHATLIRHVDMADGSVTMHYRFGQV